MQSAATLNEDARVPWNKDKLIGQKPPLKLAEIWTVRTPLRIVRRRGSWHYSTWRSTASCVAAIW